MQDRVHLLRDRHFDSARSRQADSRGRSKDSFGNHAMHFFENFWQFPSAAKFDSYAPVARKTAGASQYKIAQSGKASHSFNFASAGYYQPRYFGQAARDEGRGGIVSEAEARADTGSNRDRIFQRSAQFDTNRIFIRINSKACIAEFTLDRACQCRIL